jgi:putative transposase
MAVPRAIEHRHWTLSHEVVYGFVWLDAFYLKVRDKHRIVRQALVSATGVRETGEREALGLHLGASEEEAFRLDFLRSLVRRGLSGVHLVTSDAHEGLRAALGKVLIGASWQCCRVYFTHAPHCVRRSAGVRNLLVHISRGDKSVVAAALRTIDAQPDRQAAGIQVAEVVQATFSPAAQCRCAAPLAEGGRAPG